MTPDFSHISVIIATPCDNNSLDMFYVSSLSNTVRMLREMGATVNWHTSPGCADLPLARAKLFGKFLRSDATHMMMIDSDMGWDPIDVARLLHLNLDYVGAAGPKKGYPIVFAANNATEDGDISMIEVNQETGVIKCTEVGAAFMLMSKNCASKMAEAYEADLAWDSGGGIMEYAVFDPMIFTTPKGKRMRWSEDFSFCKRWRALGGEIHLLPDIKLKHTGTHTWEAAQTDSFLQQDQHRKLIEEGKIQDGQSINDPSSPLFDPTNPPTHLGEDKIIPGNTVMLTRLDKKSAENGESVEAA